MAQAPTSVIYLPPGVIPAGSAQPQPVPPSGVPFDRAFFEKLLPQAVQAFCGGVPCDVPVVEIFTIDGTRHFVNGISGVTDSFVALHTSREDHEHPMQVFIPYGTIYRVEIHPEPDNNRRRLGYDLSATDPPPAIQAASETPAALPAPEDLPAASKARRKRGNRR